MDIWLRSNPEVVGSISSVAWFADVREGGKRKGPRTTSDVCQTGYFLWGQKTFSLPRSCGPLIPSLWLRSYLWHFLSRVNSLFQNLFMHGTNIRQSLYSQALKLFSLLEQFSLFVPQLGNTTTLYIQQQQQNCPQHRLFLRHHSYPPMRLQ